MRLARESERTMSDATPPTAVENAHAGWDLVLTWWVPAAWIVGGILAGLVIERLVLTRLKAWSERSRWGVDNILVAGVRGVAFFWCLMLGLFMASRTQALSPESHAILGKVLVVVLMFSLTVAIARVAGGVLAYRARNTGSSAAASTIITNLVSVGIYILGFLVILDSLGVQITPILTALGVGGIAIALALKDTLENLFAGLQVVASRKMNIGDMVRLDSGDEGVITDLTWRYTTIRTPAGNLVIVPNSKLSSAIVTNYTLPAADQPVPVLVGVAYGSDLERVERIAVEVAKDVQANVDGAVRDFLPVVRFTAFADSSVTFNVVLRALSFQHQPLLRHELIKRLHARFNSEGIEIPFPMRTVQIKGNVPGPT